MKTRHAGMAIVAFSLLAVVASAQPPRLANGLAIRGEVIRATDTGLEIGTAPGKTRVYPWKTLSAGTRYRYQPIFRANFEAVLKGDPAAARTNRTAATPPGR
jgi:hypothetical protein